MNFSDEYAVYSKHIHEGKIHPRVKGDVLKVAIFNHYKFVFGWLHNGRNMEIFDRVYFLTATGFQNKDDAFRLCAVQIKNFTYFSEGCISPEDIEFLESKGVCFIKTEEYLRIKVRFLQELGS